MAKEYVKKKTVENRPWLDGDLMRYYYITLDKSILDIAEICGCGHSTICKWLHIHGIELKPRIHKNAQIMPYQKPKYLYEEHITKGRSIEDIAKEHNVTPDTIKYLLSKYNVNQFMPYTGRTVLNIDVLKKMYYEDKMSAYAISKVFGCSHRTVIDTLRSYGFETRGLQDSQINFFHDGENMDARLNDPEWLNKMFWDEKMTSNDIGKLVGVNGSTVLRQMKRLGLKTARGKNNISRRRPKNPVIKTMVINDISDLSDILRDYVRVNIRPKILNRDSHICQLCGNPNKLHVHHIKRLSKIIEDIICEMPGNNLATNEGLVKLYLKIVKDERFLTEKNLITLCSKCHNRAHGKKHRENIEYQITRWMDKKGYLDEVQLEGTSSTNNETNKS